MATMKKLKSCVTTVSALGNEDVSQIVRLSQNFIKQDLSVEEANIKAVQEVQQDVQAELLEIEQLTYNTYPEFAVEVAKKYLDAAGISEIDQKTPLLMVKKGDWTMEDIRSNYVEGNKPTTKEDTKGEKEEETAKTPEEIPSVFDTEASLLDSNQEVTVEDADGNTKTFGNIFKLNKKANSALAKFHNFFSTVRTKAGLEEILRTYDLDVRYKQPINDLIEFTRDVKNSLEGLYQSEKFYPWKAHLAPIEYLKTEDGKLPENVYGAIAMAAVSYLGTRSTESLKVEPSAINAFLGRSKHTPVPSGTQSAFNNMGTYHLILAEQLGREVRELLGLNTQKNINGHIEAQLEIDLGMRVIEAMVDMGLVELNIIPQTELDQYRSDEEKADNKFDKNVQTSFVRIKTDTITTRAGVSWEVPSNDIKSYQNFFTGEGHAVKGKDLFKALFGGQLNDFPSTKPVKSVPEMLKRQVVNVARRVKRGILGNNKNEFRAKKQHLKFINALSQDLTMRMAGAKADDEVHIEERESNQGINTGIAASFQTLHDLMKSENLDLPMYFASTVWSNNRTGDERSLISLQRDKIMRAFIGATAWDAKIKLANKNQMTLAKVAIMEAMGETGDKNSHKALVEMFHTEYMNDQFELNENVAPVIKAIQDILTNERDNLSRKEEAAILELVEKGGENLHSFDGLVALAQLHQAHKDGNKDVTLSLAREIDGVTNGVISAVMQFGMDLIGAQKILTAGGIALATNPDRNWNEYPARVGEKQQRDNYQNIALDINQAMHDILDLDESGLSKKELAKLKHKKAAVRGFQGLVGDIVDPDTGEVTSAGRKLGKSPLMLTIYGAASKSIVRDQADALLEELWGKMVKAEAQDAKLDDGSIPNQTRVLENVTKILGPYGVLTRQLKSSKGATREEKVKNLLANVDGIKNLRLHEKDKAWFKIYATLSIGAATKVSIEAYFGDMVQHQREMNEMFNLQAAVFVEHYNMAMQEIEEEQGRPASKDEIMEKMIAFRDKGLLPGAKHALSDGLKDIIQVLNKERKLVDSKDNGYVKHRYEGRGLPFNTVSRDPEGNIIKTESATTTKERKESIRILQPSSTTGASGVAKLLQSMDGSVQSTLLAQHKMLNIFDAGMYNMLDATAISRDANRVLYEKHGKWDMFDEVFTATKRFLKTIPTLDREQQLRVYNLLPLKIREDWEEQGADPVDIFPQLENFYAETARTVTAQNKAIRDAIVGVQQFPDTGNMFPIWEHLKPGTEKHTSLTQAEEVPEPPNREDVSEELANASDVRSEETSRDSVPRRGINDQLNLFGSTTSDPNAFNDFNLEWDTNVNAGTIFDTFDRLGTPEHGVGNIPEDTTHRAYLRNLIATIVKPGLERLDDILLKVGEIPGKNRGKFVRGEDGSAIYVAGSASSLSTQADMSAQEILVHETIHAVLGFGIQNIPKIRTELRNLYKLAMNAKDANGNPVITYESFLRRDEDGNVLIAETYEQEKQIAQERYDYVFNTVSNKAEYLHEFAAIGLTNAAFIDALSKIDATKPKVIYEGSIINRLVQLYQNILATIHNHTYRNTNGKIDTALRNLAINSNQIQGASLTKLDRAFETFYSYNSAASKVLQEHILKPYGNYVESRVKASKDANPVRRVVDTAIGLPHMIQVKQIRKAISNTAKNAGFTRDNTFYKSVVELRGATEFDQWLYNLNMQNKHDHDQVRERMAGDVPLQILEAWKTKLPTKGEWRSLNKIFKTDLEQLLGTYKIDQLIAFHKSPSALRKEIGKHRGIIRRFTHADYYLNQAENLGKMLIDNRSRISNSMKNAFNIANLLTTGRTAPDHEVEAAETEIDILVSLYAIEAMHSKDRKTVAKFLTNEYAEDPNENGMNMMLGLHRSFKEESLEQLFSGNKVSMEKGWTFEMYSQYRSSEVQPGDDATVEAMKRKGYKKMTPVSTDPNSNLAQHQDLWLYVSKDGLLNRRESGAVSLTDLHASGTDIPALFKQDGRVYNILQASQKELAMQKTKNAAEVNLQFAGPVKMDNATNHMVPIVSPRFGDVVNYRYEMSETNKENYMAKKDMAHFVMGRMMASLVDKVQTPISNKKYLEGAFKDYVDNFTDTPDEFVFIGPKSTNEKYKEIYRLWPESMKNDAKRIWYSDSFDEEGNQIFSDFDEGIWVREETVDLAFGYRKLSITDYIDNKFKKADGTGGIPVMMKRAMKHSGNIWQAVVSRAKRNIVIMMPAVLQNNVFSNELLLIMNGVPPAYSLKYQTQGILLVEEYRKTRRKIEDLERYNKAYPTSAKVKKNEQRIARLTEELKASPLDYMIKQGVFQNISEDIRADAESQLGEAVKNSLPWVETFVDKTEGLVPEFIQRGYDQAIIAPGTELNTLLTRATQYSDFVSRYTLFKYLTEEKNMKPREALNIAVDTFINYDVPTSPEVQWLNDMGILLFTKFLFRIQRILLRRVLDAPLTVGGIQAAQMLTANVPDVYDDPLTVVSLANRFPGPINVVDAGFEVNLANQIGWFPWMPFF